jgi:hypothetical protein
VSVKSVGFKQTLYKDGPSTPQRDDKLLSKMAETISGTTGLQKEKEKDRHGNLKSYITKSRRSYGTYIYVIILANIAEALRCLSV